MALLQRNLRNAANRYFYVSTTCRAVFTVSNEGNNHNSSHNSKSNLYKKLALCGLLGASYAAFQNKTLVKAISKNQPDKIIIDIDEVSKHNNMIDGVWVTHEGKVYDITNFVDNHPGGKKILLAAGGSLEPFWALYGMHNSPAVKELLEEYRIGSLSEKDKSKSIVTKIDDPYSNDPRRHPALKSASVKPYNAEPPAALLVDSYKTPNDLFYVRNHMPVPDIDSKTFQLKIVGKNNEEKVLSLDDIKTFPKCTVTAVIQCAGNRRSEMSKVKSVKGLYWGQAAIGNADWSGARLVDVLNYYGFSDVSDIRHIHFHGLDTGVDGVSYAASVPADIVLDPRQDVLLAYEMNGAPISRDHGAPLRVVVPGIVGARNVKWLNKIVLSQVESDSHWQQGDYKGLPPSADFNTADFSKAPAIQELPVSSAICVPEDGETVARDDGVISVKGYAWSGGGRSVVRVDVSADAGKTWQQADLRCGPCNDSGRQWAWTLWSIEVPVPQKSNQIELWAKAIDSSYNVQPESFEHIWNFRGVLGNAFHKITVNIS